MITGVVSEQDYVDAHVLHYRHVNIVLNWVLAAILIIGIVLLATGAGRWGAGLVGGGVCGFIGAAIQRFVYLPSVVRKHYAQFKGIDTPITYTWDAETVSVRSSRGTGQRRWDDLRKVKENDRLVLLYTTDVLFEVVPKAWFSNAEQLDQFRSYAHVGRET